MGFKVHDKQSSRSAFEHVYKHYYIDMNPRYLQFVVCIIEQPLSYSVERISIE